jgi:hypothetical protein
MLKLCGSQRRSDARARQRAHLHAMRRNRQQYKQEPSVVTPLSYPESPARLAIHNAGFNPRTTHG